MGDGIALNCTVTYYGSSKKITSHYCIYCAELESRYKIAVRYTLPLTNNV